MDEERIAVTLEEAQRLLAAKAYASAAEAARQLQLDTPSASATYVLGLACFQLDSIDEALEHLREAVRIEPHQHAWLYSLSQAHGARSEWSAAVPLLTRCLELAPNNGRYQRALGYGLFQQNRFDEAWRAYTLAQDIAPEDARVRREFGKLATALSLDDFALEQFEAWTRIEPNSARAWADAAAARLNLGDLPQCLNYFRRAVDLAPENADYHSSLLFALHHDPNLTPTQLLAECRSWAALRTPSPATCSPRATATKLRIGYLTGELNEGPSRFVFLPYFRNRDRDSFEVYCYYSGLIEDRVSQEFQSESDAWHHVFGWADERVADQIRADKVDLLVSLSGHLNHNRLPVFALRPASIQVSLPSYPGTTGMEVFDAALVGPATESGALQSQFTEPLRPGPLLYDPPPLAPVLTPLPRLTHGYITFGLFQRPSKLNENVIAAVARILHAVPDSRLLIHHVSRNWEAPNSWTRNWLGSLWQRNGVDATRIGYLSGRSLPEHLGTIASVDIALDTFPYGGYASSGACLWMGVPVITLRGQTPVGRVSSWMLNCVGLSSYIAETEVDYCDHAVELASDLPRLAQLRATLRDRMLGSPLLDHAGATRQLESTYLRLWHQATGRS
jgi:protein O-GlcNAc transferase